PRRSKAEARRVAAVAKLGVPVLAHARARREDIDAVHASGASQVGIFLGINEISRAVRVPGASTDALLAMITDAVSHAHRLGLVVRFTVEDASRTPRDELLLAYETARRAGADRLCFADTVGILGSREIEDVVADLVRHFPGLPVEVHLHDDRGLAMANALAAIDAGATWVSTSVNGLGERCGITDLATLLANLEHLGIRELEDGAAVQRLSRLVAAHARAPVDARRPVVGRHAFTHTARLHALAEARDEMAYSWIRPYRVGRETVIAEPAAERERDVVEPRVIGASELPFHRDGPGVRYVLLDERLHADCRQYLIARHFPPGTVAGPGHVDSHRHDADSWFVFLGDQPGLAGLAVEVTLGERRFTVSSPASVFIPAGMPHSYRFVAGSGLYFNHVPVGRYERSLLDEELPEPAGGHGRA
ncbi:MAG: 2-isopropylmalate synthase, partial [Planctomycetes bacterium]|nr:2-isopropylmalate synthase [Planctomycetota bacterium]